MPGGINLQSEWMCFQDTIKAFVLGRSQLYPVPKGGSQLFLLGNGSQRRHRSCGSKHFSCPSSLGSRKKSSPLNNPFPFKLHISLFWLDRNNMKGICFRVVASKLHTFTENAPVSCQILRLELTISHMTASHGRNSSVTTQYGRTIQTMKQESRTLLPGPESRLNLVFNLFIILELKIPQ